MDRVRVKHYKPFFLEGRGRIKPFVRRMKYLISLRIIRVYCWILGYTKTETELHKDFDSNCILFKSMSGNDSTELSKIIDEEFGDPFNNENCKYIYFKPDIKIYFSFDNDRGDIYKENNRVLIHKDCLKNKRVKEFLFELLI